MRTVIPFLLLLLLTFTSIAQPITHLSGNAVINGITVTVSQSTPPPNTATLCSTGPYQIGKNYADHYEYSFSDSVTHFTIKAIRFHDDDTMQVLVNGTPYNFTGGVPYNGDANCNLTTNNMVYPGNGMVTTSGGATGPGQGVELELTVAPRLIKTVTIKHIRAANNNLASDIIYSAEFKNDSCALDFNATVSAPLCAGKDAQLSATYYPNTTYQWTPPPGATPPNFAPSSSILNPTLQNLSVLNTGTYTVTGTRGVCVYQATVNLPITTPPVIGNVIQTGPECPNAADTIKVPNISLIGGTVYGWGPNGLAQFDNNGYFLDFPSVQLSDRGDYYIYAIDVQGCVSDTVKYNFDVLTGVAAGFNYKIKEGCEEDTIVFTNSSINNNAQVWSFGDNTPNSTLQDPTHMYTVPKPNNAGRTYTVELAVSNGSCADTTEQDIELNHPIVADFTIDDDSICQGTIITFDNNSIVKPGTIPNYSWDLGFGDKENIPNLSHTRLYNTAGIYHPELTLTDYLGCEAKLQLELVVDSVGGIDFAIDKDNVCLGDEVIFTGDYYSTGANSVVWDFKDGVVIPDSKQERHSFAEAGTYTVTYSIDYRICPNITKSTDVIVRPYPKLYLGDDTAICPGSDPVYIENKLQSANPGVSYSWNTTTRDVTKGIYVRSPGLYALTAELDGCSTTDTIKVRKNCYIDIPNAFTPNGDGNSDYFLPRQFLSRNITEFSMQVYNRWGEQVFVSDAVDGRGWDGRYNGEMQPVGVYVYTIQVKFGNGVNERYQGNVSLLR